MNKALTITLWIAVTAVVLVLVTVPVSLQTHLVMGSVLLGAMMIIKVLKLEGNWRLLLLTFGTIVVMRYAYWRTTSTLPPIDQWTDFIPGLISIVGSMLMS